ncbi:mitochondrial 39-S ribosomal protein L47 (MRP-L47)-domain-containing protein [Chytriomyces sp. MP71]|nr:mitochondrial 39-S ribosomal protein L47 (MRP-L47)-domain-containing protein [Chytriomyces sp. MP71]
MKKMLSSLVPRLRLHPTARLAPAAVWLPHLTSRFAAFTTSSTAESSGPVPAPTPAPADSTSSADSFPAYPPMAASISTTGSGGKGLLDFFDSEKGWYWSESDPKTGRGWTCAELRTKSFDDLHRLWWICIKEQNKLLSQRDEARMFKVIFPNGQRLQQVRITMRGIRLVVQERRIAYLQAQAIVEREAVRQEMFKTFLDEYKAQNPAAAVMESEVAEEEASAGKKALPEGWIPTPPEVVVRVEAEMKKLYPVPVHEVGRKSEERRRIERALDVTGNGRKSKKDAVKRDKMKGSRWTVV